MSWFTIIDLLRKGYRLKPIWSVNDEYFKWHKDNHHIFCRNTRLKEDIKDMNNFKEMEIEYDLFLKNPKDFKWKVYN